MNKTKRRKKVSVMIGCFIMMLSGTVGILMAMDIKTVTASGPVVSSDISILGFQMKAEPAGQSLGVSFRAVAKVPKIGSTITVSGKKYTVKQAGTIYVLDPDISGIKEQRKLDDTYTLLNSSKTEGSDRYIKGSKLYNGQLRTYGYIATEQSMLDVVEDNDTTHVYYATTMTKMDKDMANTLLVRAFVIASDGTIIYGENTKVTSVAGIAYQLYTKSKSDNRETHCYLYQKILNSKKLADIYSRNKNYPYYLTKEMEYGWEGMVSPE